MRFRFKTSLLALFVCSTLAPSDSFGQSLSIKKGETNYLVEASAPANDPRTLQVSDNLSLWIDVRTGIVGPETIPIDSTNVSQRYFRLISPQPEAPPIRVMILSDSMASDCCGWGGGIYGYFKPNATVINYGIAWTSTKVFLQSEEAEKMLLIKPQYVLMQYGFIDGAGDPDRGTTIAEFEANLRTIIQMVRSFDGVPVLITLHVWRVWDEQGKISEYNQERNDVVRRLASELNAPLIDLYKITVDAFNELGPEGAAFMDIGWPGDVLHVSAAGARYVSWFVVKGLPGSLGPYLTNIPDSPPIP